jgi:SAM-dependent methyltransferase
MARKKAPLGNVALASLPVGPVATPAALHSGAMTARADESDRDAIESLLLQLIPPYSRVLVIGRDTWPLSRTLASAGCHVSIVEARHDAPAGSASFSDRVVVSDPDALDLNATLEGAQFDAIVAVRLLEHVRNPAGMLTALGKHLTADGGIVAAVPNVMHATIRLGFLAGRSPAGLLSPDASSPSHWYDSETLQHTFQRAGFVITRIERHVETVDPDGSPLEGARLPPALVEELTRNADAMTRTYVVLAHPFPLAGHVRLELRVRDLSQSHDRSVEHMKALDERTAGLDGRYAELKRVCDGTLSRIDRLGEDMQLVAGRDTRLQPALVSVHQRLASGRAGLDAVRRNFTRFLYELLVLRVRTVVESVIPPGATALVVSKGDEQLITFNGRSGWHFLRNDKGLYAGHHPADSAAAIAALEQLRAAGAAYLVFPQVALWWLDHYAGLRDHLDKRGRVVARDERTAVIYALDREEAGR